MVSSPEPSAAEPAVRVRVLHRPPGHYLRYVDQVVGDGGARIEYSFGRTGLRDADVDVVHLPRFDALQGTQGSSGPALVKAVLVFAAQLIYRRIALVRTLHGSDRQRPRDRWERLATWILNRVTTAFILLDEAATAPRPGRTTVIQPGHFRDRFSGFPRSEQTAGRLLFVAPVQLGGGVAVVLRAFPDATTPSLSLRVIGPAPRALAEQITRLTEEHASISAQLEPVSTGTVIREMTTSELVVLPGVERLEELTVLLSALSLDRPVLVPDSPSARALADTYGNDWVRRYSGPLTGATIDSAVSELRSSPPQGRPRLDGRDLATTGAAYAAVFTSAAKRRGSRRAR